MALNGTAPDSPDLAAATRSFLPAGGWADLAREVGAGLTVACVALPICISSGVLAYSPLAAGLLSGKYLDGARPTGSRLSINGDLGGRFTPHQEPAVAGYVQLAREHGIDPAQMAIAFCLTRPFMASVIIGATSMEQLKTNLGAANLTLSQDVMNGIRRLHRLYPMPI